MATADQKAIVMDVNSHVTLRHVEERLGYRFEDRRLLEIAFLEDKRDEEKVRLAKEGTVALHELVYRALARRSHRYRHKPEALFSDILAEQNLSRVYSELVGDEELHSSRGYEIKRSGKAKRVAMKALLGAIYEDSGKNGRRVEDFAERYLLQRIFK